MKILGRDPALYLALFSSLVMAAGLAFNLTIDQQGALNAAAVAIIGIFISAAVHNGTHAAALGGLKAVLAVGLSFGLKLSPQWQATIMTIAATASAMFVRQTVTAPVAAKAIPPDGVAPHP